MTQALSPNKSSSRTAPRPSRKIVKWLLWLGVGVFILLLGVGLLLTYWFPSDLVRQQLEARLSVMLEGTVTIRTLSFNALTGLQVGDLEFRKPNQPPFTFERLALDYSLLGLLTGTFTINEVTVEKANISLNLPELSQAAPVEQSDVPPPAEPATLPTFPISIDLDTFAIIDSHLQVTVSPDLQVELSKINLHSSGAVSPEDANLKGQLTIDRLAIDFQRKHLQLPIKITFKTQLHLPKQHLNLEQFTIVSDPALRMTLSGSVSKFFTQDQINLSLTDTQFHLDTLVRLAQEFVPPEWASATIGGTLSPTFSIRGALPDTQFQGTIQAGLQSQDLQVSFPSLAIDLGPTSLDIQAEDIRLQKNQPTEGTLSAKVTSQSLTFQSYRMENLDLVLASDGHASGPFSGNLSVRGTTTIPPDMVGTPLILPFDLTLDTSGNHLTRQVLVKNLNADLGPYGNMKMKGELQPHPSPNQGMDASLEIRLSPKIKALLSLLPKDQLQGLVLQKGTGPDTLIVQATAGLHPDFRPEWAKATAALKLSSLQAQWDSFGAEGTMNQLTFLLASDYQEKNGAFQGTVGFSSNLSNLRATESMTIETSHVILKSSFQGNLSPTYQPTSLRSQDQLQLTLGNMSYQDPSLTATLPSLRLSTKTKEDVLKKDYLLESLRLTSDKILHMSVKGRFRQANQQFDVDLQIPLLHVGNLLPHLSGPLMKGVDEINPNGRISLALRTEGKIPQADDLKQLTLPLGLRGKLTFRDLEGAVAGYQIQEGNGTMTLGYSPQATPQTQLTTDVTLNRIHLPDTLPIRELSDTSLHVSMVSPDFNEVQIDPIQITSKGVDLSLQGTVVGLRELLSSTALRGTQLAKLFAQLETRLGLDVETFQEALQPLGVKGTGKALVTLSMLKKEQGSLEASLEIGAETLSLTRDDTELRNMNGGMQFRKSLAWKPEGLRSPTKKKFQPSDRIAQLKSFSRKGQTLTIDHLQLGPLTIQNLSTNLAFEQHTLKMQNLVMNLLGGGIGSNVIIAAQRPLRISAGLEVANLDANQLITTQSKIKGDSNIAATIGLTTILQDVTGAVDLSRLECNLQITHIGKEALDRLLVFLDPEGSNPTLSNARAQLKLANPSSVSVEVARGQLNLTIHFQGSLIPTFRLDRVPIAKMKNIEKLTAAIPNWEDLKMVLELIGAETYSFTPEGKIVFQ